MKHAFFRTALATLAAAFLCLSAVAEDLSADVIWAAAKSQAKEHIAEGDMEGARRILAEAKKLISELEEGDSRVPDGKKPSRKPSKPDAEPETKEASPHSAVVFVLEDGTMYLKGESGRLDAETFRKTIRKGLKKDGDAFSVRVFADATVRHGDVQRLLDVCTAEGLDGIYMDKRGVNGRLIQEFNDGPLSVAPYRYSWAVDPAPLTKSVYASWRRSASDAADAFPVERIFPGRLGEVDWIRVRRPTPDDIPEPLEPLELEEEPPPEPPKSEFPEPVVVDVNGPATNRAPVENPFELQNEVLSVVPAEQTAVSYVRSPVVMHGVMANRSPGARGRALAKYGAGGGEAVVMRALRWLKMNQRPDGSWDGCAPAMTGLAVLTYLAHGEVPDDSTEFGPTVQRAIQWLVNNQDGSGFFRGRDGNNYAQSIAACALGEAYAMTKNPDVKTAAEKALVPIVKGQHESGSWDYNFRIDERDDTSFAGWAAQAVKAAHTAELDVPGLDNCYANIAKGMLVNYDSTYGGFGYTSKGHTGLSGVGAFCMQMAGDYDRPEVMQTMNLLETAQFGWDKWDGPQPYTAASSPVYQWYYITQAKFQAGGETFKRWNAQFLRELMTRQIVIPKQIADLKGDMRDVGYWDSPAPSEHGSGSGAIPCKRWVKGVEVDGTTTMGRRVQDTCLCALQLMAYYRFVPASQLQEESLQPPAPPKKGSKERNRKKTTIRHDDVSVVRIPGRVCASFLDGEDDSDRGNAVFLVPDPEIAPNPSLNDLTTVDIGKPLQGTPYFFLLDKKRSTEEMLSGYFKKIARNNRDETVLFNVTKDAPNGLLLRALELAEEAGLRKCLVFSLDNTEPRPGWPVGW